jgi:hypothetical protein
MHSSHRPREGARLEVVWDNMGHTNIVVTQNVYWQEGWRPGLLIEELKT